MNSAHYLIKRFPTRVVWEQDNPASLHSPLGMKCRHYHAEWQHWSLIFVFSQCNILYIYTFHCCLSLLIYTFHLLLIEIVLCKIQCTCTTTLMLLVNSVMPPKKMQYENHISTYNQCNMIYITLK